MPQVKLVKPWFGPGGQRFRVGTHEMSDELVEVLPSSAKVLEEPKPASKPPVAEKK